MEPPVTAPTDLDFLLNDLTTRVPQVAHAVAVSADGLVLAATAGLGDQSRDQLAAVGSGLVSLLRGAARFFEAGRVISNVTEMDGGFMFSMSVSSGASLLVLAAKDCDIGRVGHELADLINRVGPVLTPRERAGATYR
jgi:hypothetical protein